jgi:hypothetical protein
MVEGMEFIINKCPVGVLIFDRKLTVIDHNKKASIFLNRFKLPEDVINVAGRLFDAFEIGKLDELFPGEIHITKKLEGSASNWV